ncbi:MAG: ABC transporter ATP-binding protein [Acidimicrobiales bacterium]|nr:ABC transporter ATP-binding protein [Acidimicrobiales bacterium]
MPAIEVEDLSITYGSTVAVDGLSFTGEMGEVLAVLGPNGAGKTSTVEVLEGYRRPSGGRVSVLGLDPIADHATLMPEIGVMLQAGGVSPGVRPAEVLRTYASFYADPLDPAELLERVGLTSVRRSSWRNLSGGEQQRLSLAMALVGRPRVAFLDEPTNSVDVQGRQLIRALVRDLAHDGTCVVLTTHDLAEAEKVADRVVIIDHGKLVIAGRPRDLTSATGSEEILFGAAAGLDTASLSEALEAAVSEVSPGEYRVSAEPTPATIARLTAWLADHDQPLADLRAGRQRLEDVFMRLTRESAESDGSDTPVRSRSSRRRGQAARR